MNKVVIVILFTLLFPLSGCWDLTELNELSIVTGIGVDKGENLKYLVTIELLNPPALAEATQGNQSASILISYETDSIAEMARKTNIVYTRKMVYSHIRTLVISAEVAREGLLEFFEFFESDREIRNDFNMLIVENATAKEVYEVMYPIQKVSSLKINAQLETMVNEWGGDPDVRLKDIISALLSPGREPVMAQVKVKGPPQKGNHLENIKKINVDTYIELEGMAIFKEMKYLGNLPISDARNFLLLQNKLNKTSITVHCAENNITTARISDSNTSIKAKYKDNIPHFMIDINLEGRLETTQCPDDFSKIKTYKDYEKKFSEGFEKEIMETIKTVQEQYKVDIFGFGEHMERQDYDNFKKNKENWNEDFAKAEFELNVKLILRRSGLTTKPFIVELEK